MQKHFHQISTHPLLPTVCAIISGIICVWMLASSLFSWRLDWKLAHSSPNSAYVSTKNETAEMLASLPEAHLFGQNITSETPVADLHAKVTGIVSIEDEKHHEHSKAYISVSDQPSKIYKPGDELTNGVKVYDITPDTVILEVDGHLEKLPLPRGSLTFKPRDKEPE